MRTTWDIFCNVVDNYGDIGIAWRLARGLVRGRAWRWLWVDDLRVSAHLAGSIRMRPRRAARG
jgi:hypothetical protein